MELVRQGRFLVATVLGVGLTLGTVAAAQGNSDSNAGQQPWKAPVVFAKGELIDAMASQSGLSKADSKKALDGFINATSSALASGKVDALYCWGNNTGRASDPPPFQDPDDDGDGLGDLVDFGVFSTSSGGVDAAGCPTPREVVFESGPSFRPLEETFAKAIPPSIAGVEVTAPTNRDAADETPRCEKPAAGLDDAYLIESIAGEAQLPVRSAALALDACFSVIAQVVNSGGIVDLEGFGRFEAVTELTAKITETRGRTPILALDIWEHSMSLSGASDHEIYQAAQVLASISKRSARTGRNPQTGKEIKIAAKRGVKFKAGAELSKSVN